MSESPPEADSIDPLAADLARLVSETRAVDARRERAQERALRHQASADATLVGLLLDLAEEGAEVTVRTTAGRLHQGRITTLGRDFAAISTAPGEVSVKLDTLATIRRLPGQRGPDPAGHRSAPRDISLAAYLGVLASERPRVSVVVAGERTPLVGELVSVGRDVATLRLSGVPTVTAYVALASLSEVLVSG